MTLYMITGVNCDYNIIRSSLANINCDPMFNVYTLITIHLMYLIMKKKIKSKHLIWLSSLLRNLIFKQ